MKTLKRWMAKLKGVDSAQVAVSSTDWLESNGWIDINKQRPPMTADTPETGGFFLCLRHDPKRDAEGQYRMEVWFGSTMLDTKYWTRIPAYKQPGLLRSNKQICKKE